MRQLDSITDSKDMSEQTPGDIGGQRSLACCTQSWGCDESDTTQQPNNKDAYHYTTVKTHTMYKTRSEP